jgi:hypothetical protein
MGHTHPDPMVSADLPEHRRSGGERELRRTGKFYLFLREVRADLFDDAFQTGLAVANQPRGTAPLPAALLAMVTSLQAYDQIGDAEAVETAQVDLRWRLVLGCLGCTRAPFSQGALVKFRERMTAHDLGRRSCSGPWRWRSGPGDSAGGVCARPCIPRR